MELNVKFEIGAQCDFDGAHLVNENALDPINVPDFVAPNNIKKTRILNTVPHATLNNLPYPDLAPPQQLHLHEQCNTLSITLLPVVLWVSK